ncbi:Ribosomal protein L1p/L10e family [Perilla frutescens var. frutescens]|nr:Ribosomal protein L1p/L10e family [Perilla frutescens var. frutescens]
MTSSNTEPLAASATHSRVSKSAVEAAVTALLKHKAAQSANEKPQLLPQDDYFYLNLTLKKLPSNARTNPYRIPLPHPVLDAAVSELCLIVDDRPRTTTPPSDEIKKLIKSQNIPISKVIKISKLKTNYKPFEAKRKLCDSYDLFLVDKRVVHLLPKLIGKEFFKKKKLPLGVDLGKKNLKLQVERALGSALFYIRTGTCCVMKVGKVEMEKDEIVENVMDAINGAVERVPKKWDGVRSLHLKFCDSVALPIYQAMPDVRLKIEGLKDRQEGGEASEISDNDSGRKDGKSGKKKKKGRIHEVRYMDVGEDVDSDIDDMGDEFMGMEEDIMQKGDDENEELKIEESVGKKKRKGVKAHQKEEGVLGDLNGLKKSEEIVGVKLKKDGLLRKKKSELRRKKAEGTGEVNDVKKKKRVIKFSNNTD